MSKITTAIIPVAGYGTRRLPVTKALEKCMLPVGNRPIVDYVVADCVAAGIREIWFVVGEDSRQIREYFGRNFQLEKYLRARKKLAELRQIQPPKNVDFHFVTQPPNGKYGTTIPVALALKDIAKNRRVKNLADFHETILVVMGDDFLYYHDKNMSGARPRGEIIAKHSDFARLLNSRKKVDEAAMLAVEISREKVMNYGVIDFCEDKNGEKVFREIVEKPSRENAPSNLINISKYIFPPKLLRLIARHAQTKIANGEYLITEPINQFVASGGVMKVVPARGEYLDGGNLAGWLRANEVVGRDLLKKDLVDFAKNFAKNDDENNSRKRMGK